MIINTPIPHTKLRRVAYPEVGEQLDALMKVIKNLSDQGVDIGNEGRELIEKCEHVKDQYPKAG